MLVYPLQGCWLAKWWPHDPVYIEGTTTHDDKRGTTIVHNNF